MQTGSYDYRKSIFASDFRVGSCVGKCSTRLMKLTRLSQVTEKESKNLPLLILLNQNYHLVI